MADARRTNQAASTPSAPSKRAAVSTASTSANKPGPTSSAPARPTEASSSAAPRPAAQRSGSAESDAAADAAQQRRKDNWLRAHWDEFSPRADRNPSYVVIFDRSPAEVRAAVVKDILGGTEPRLSTMTCDLSALDKALGNKPDFGEVQVAIMEAENFSALSDAFETYTTTVVKGEGERRRTAFVPLNARPRRAPVRD